MKDSLLYKGPVDPANWVGIMKADVLLDYLRVSAETITNFKCAKHGTVCVEQN